MRREERGGEEGDALMDGCMSHTLSPPLRGEERVWGSPNLPTAASPLLKGEWMMVMCDSCDSSGRSHEHKQWKPRSES